MSSSLEIPSFLGPRVTTNIPVPSISSHFLMDSGLYLGGSSMVLRKSCISSRSRAI